MRSRRSLPSTPARRLIPIRSTVPILIHRHFTRAANSRGIGCMRVPDVGRSRVGWQGIGVLLGVRGITFWLALPEFPLWRAGCVAVVWGGAEGALFAAVADEKELEGDGEEEEDPGDSLARLHKSND